MAKKSKVERVIIRDTASGKFLTWNGQTVTLTGGTDDDITAVSNNLCAILGIA